jgi:predicted kinase
MAEVDDRISSEAVPAPGLLILTGASHTGKTSVAREILALASPPAAFLSVDDALRTVLARPPGEIWEQIPLAYELLRLQLEALLDRGWLVVLESTFTFVPASGAPEFHADRLRQLIGVAEERGVPWALIQLSADEADLASRANESNRLPHEIVAKTVELHESADLPDEGIQLDSSAETPPALARRALSALESRPRRPSSHGASASQ